MHQRRRTALLAACALVSGVLLLAGCAPSDRSDHARPDIVVVPGAAVLDPVSETVRLPLDAFGPDALGRQRIQRASDLLTEDCAAERGVDVALVDVLDFPPTTLGDLNFFGVWTRERALRTGLGPASDPLTSARLAWDGTVPRAAYEVVLACPDESDEAAAALAEPSPADSVLARGTAESWEWAESDPVWRAALLGYRGCMQERGWTFDDAWTPYSPVLAEAADSESGIRAALDQVDCLQSTGAAQTFVDVVAAYQVAFLEENEAALTAEDAEWEQRLTLARRVIGEHGGA